MKKTRQFSTSYKDDDSKIAELKQQISQKMILVRSTVTFRKSQRPSHAAYTEWVQFAQKQGTEKSTSTFHYTFTQSSLTDSVFLFL